MMRGLLVIVGSIALAVTSARGQAFEVASIRQDPPGKYIPSKFPLSADDNYILNGGGLLSAHSLLIDYIIFAYRITDASQYPLVMAQLPKWAQTESFAIEARTEPNATKDQMRAMMRTLLEDRFKLSVRMETRELPHYALVLDKPGKPAPGLQPDPDDSLCTKMPDPSAPKPPRKEPTACQPILVPENGLTNLRIGDFTMEQIAGSLGSLGAMLGGLDALPVVDQTGLSGRYDFSIRFVRAPKGPQPADAEALPPGATFTDALKTQAGLRLVKSKGPVKVFVVDHVEQPTEN